MNDENATQVLRELRIIRICAVVSAAIFVLAFVWHILNIHL
jgi:hypothetical protein